MDRRKLRLALATTLISTALGLLLGEVIARQVYGEGFALRLDAYEDHPYRPYLDFKVQWGPRRYRMITNNLGWRDSTPRRRVEKDPGKRTRILFLGDSFTEGVGVPYEESIPAVVGRGLGSGYEVLNSGRASYSPLLEYQRLRRFLEEGYKTDVIVLLPDVSDPLDESIYNLRYEFAPDGEPLKLREAAYGPLLRGIYNASALARGARRIQWEITDRLSAHPASATSPDLALTGTMTAEQLAAVNPIQQRILKAAWVFHPPSLNGWAPQGLRSIEGNIARIDRLARERSIPLLVAIYPWPTLVYHRDDPAEYAELERWFGTVWQDRERIFGRRPGPPEFEYERRMRALCSRLGVPLVDLFPELRSRPRWWELYIQGDLHFNERGYGLAGERITAALRPLLATQRRDPR